MILENISCKGTCRLDFQPLFGKTGLEEAAEIEPRTHDAQEKSSCTRPSSQKIFLHVELAGKNSGKLDVPWFDAFTFYYQQIVKTL